MQLVFVASTNPKPFKLTSTPLLNFAPYVQKFNMDTYTTIDHHIKLNSLDDEISDFYTLIKKSIEDYCKDNGIKSFTLNGNITLNLIKKDLVEFEKLKKEKDPYCEACSIFGKLNGEKPKIPVPDLNNAFESLSISVWKQDDKINIKTADTDKLFDFDFYQKYDLITSKLSIPTPVIGEYYSGFSTSLVDDVLDELRTMRLELKPTIESNSDNKELILDHSGNPIVGRYIIVKPGATIDEIDLGGVRLKASAVRANPYLTAAVDARSTGEKIDAEIEKKLLALEELAEKNAELKKALETMQAEAEKVIAEVDNKINEGGTNNEETSRESTSPSNESESSSEKPSSENQDSSEQVSPATNTGATEESGKTESGSTSTESNTGTESTEDSDGTKEESSDENLTEEEKLIKEHLDIINKLAEKNSKLKELLDKENIIESIIKEQLKPAPKFTKKFITFNVLSDNMFYGDSNYINITEFDVSKSDVIDALISSILNKSIVPIINKEDICIFINIETSAYSGKTMLRKETSIHNASYNGQSFHGAFVGPIIYTYGPNPTSGPFGTAYAGGDGLTSHDGVYKSLHTMGYANEAHIVHHNEINVIKSENIKYNKNNNELIVII